MDKVVCYLCQPKINQTVSAKSNDKTGAILMTDKMIARLLEKNATQEKTQKV